MAIQTINLTVPGGDTPRSANTKINANFSNATHAASRLVGTAAGNVMEVGAFGLGGNRETYTATALASSKDGFIKLAGDHGGVIPASVYSYNGFSIKDGTGGTALVVPNSTGSAAAAKSMGYRFVTYAYNNSILESVAIYTTGNTTIVNGNLKPSSPVVKIHTDSLELNGDAERMGVTLNKRGVGDYLIQNTTGLRKDDGWYIELPQDVNGNPYFAVTYNQLENNDIEVKTYKRIFDMSTFMFMPDLDNPIDIKEGRSIAIRFNDLPQETPTDLDKTNL